MSMLENLLHLAGDHPREVLARPSSVYCQTHLGNLYRHVTAMLSIQEAIEQKSQETSLEIAIKW